LTASVERLPSKLTYGLRLAGLIGLFLTYVPLHLLSKWLLGRSSWPPRFLRHAGLIAGVRPRIEGVPLQPHTFVIANHTSWLDILILGGWAGTAFVSKAELKTTPVLGWIADQNRTLYIDRAARRDSHGQVMRIIEALEHHQPLAVFPEGTTGSGRHLMPFRSTLLEAVAPPPPRVSVRPVAIDYGDHADVVAAAAASGEWTISGGCWDTVARCRSASARSTRFHRIRIENARTTRAPVNSLPCLPCMRRPA
jgi:1-acyl-sn-glycerol-3-phosphate acyltransferase